MTTPSFEQLRVFFEDSPLAHKAAASLRNGAEVALVIGEKTYTFTKEGGRNKLHDHAARKPDVIFTMPEASALELVTRRFDSVAQVGLHIFEDVLSEDPARKVTVRVMSGFLTLMTSGYLGILTAGGAELARFLGAKGFGSAGKIKDAISKLKG